MALTAEDEAWIEEQLEKAPPMTQQQVDVLSRLLATTTEAEAAS